MISNIYLLNLTLIHRYHDMTFEDFIQENFQTQLNDHCPEEFSIISVTWINDSIVSSLLNFEARKYKEDAEKLLGAMCLSIGYIRIQVEGPACLERKKASWLEWVYKHIFGDFFFAVSYCFYLVQAEGQFQFELIEGYKTPTSSSPDKEYSSGKINDYAELMYHYFYNQEIPDQCSDRMAKLILNIDLDALEVG